MISSEMLLTPDARGFYGEYGGAFVPEILRPALQDLAAMLSRVREDEAFWRAFLAELSSYAGRPTPLTALGNLSRELGGAMIYVKREDLNHTGAHKINNVIGQAMLAKRLGKDRVIAETGAGQHGVATATAAARLGLKCTVFMGAKDVRRQYPNVFWMRQMGAEVIAVEDGARTLKDAINAAMRDWSESFPTTHYILGTAAGPHPFPQLVSWLQSVIGKEARQQWQALGGSLPKAVYACVGGGSNALGLFQGFMDLAEVELVGAEAGGDSSGHAARIAGGEGQPGISHGYRSLFLQTAEGQMAGTHSLAAGLDYVGVSPLLADLAARKRVRFVRIADEQAFSAARLLIRREGIIPALETAHGLAAAIAEAPDLAADQALLVNLSGRGDKDIFNFGRATREKEWRDFLSEEMKEYAGDE
jgi:tryptophan synthase beta chain